jgi:putative transcriptional regulator
MQNKVQQLRTRAKLSQAELGERLSVSRQTINSIETLRYTPSLALAMAISRFFKKRVEEVFSDDQK